MVRHQGRLYHCKLVALNGVKRGSKGVVLMTSHLSILRTAFSLVAAHCPFLGHKDGLYWGSPKLLERLPGTDQPYPESALQSSMPLVTTLIPSCRTRLPPKHTC